jgi:hypothetical protein
LDVVSSARFTPGPLANMPDKPVQEILEDAWLDN